MALQYDDRVMSEYCTMMSYYDNKIEDVTVKRHDVADFFRILDCNIRM